MGERDENVAAGRGVDHGLVELAEAPSADDVRPCARCVTPCPCARRSVTCTCACSPRCPRSAALLAPTEDVPVEAGVLPLAFELASLRHFPIVAACAGHAAPATSHARRPEVRFHGRSLAHVDVLAASVAERARAVGVEDTWSVVVVPPEGVGPSTFALVALGTDEVPNEVLHQQAHALAGGLAAIARARARRALDEIGALAVDPESSLARSDPRVRGLEDLTRREREVLGHFLQGFAPATIAAELGISTQTARNHLKNLSAKVGVRSQRELRELFATRIVLWR